MDFTKPIVNYNEETGVTTCEFIDNNGVSWIGVANCHPDDRDMMSQMTGATIAEYRAVIKYFAHLRDTEYLPKVKVLRHLYSCMEQAKNFNPKENNARLTLRAIADAEVDLMACRAIIKSTRETLYKFRKDKAELFKRARAIKGSN